MAFSWTEDIGKGTADISKAAIEEIRTNLDQIKDNEACVSDKVSDHSEHNVSYDAEDDAGYDAADKIGVDTGYNSTYKSDYKVGVDDTNYGTIHFGVHTEAYANENSTVYSGHA